MDRVFLDGRFFHMSKQNREATKTLPHALNQRRRVGVVVHHLAVVKGDVLAEVLRLEFAVPRAVFFELSADFSAARLAHVLSRQPFHDRFDVGALLFGSLIEGLDEFAVERHLNCRVHRLASWCKGAVSHTGK